MATCLVTGGAGFIGSTLVEQLLARHNTVRVLDNLTGTNLVNLCRVLHAIEFYPGDVADLALVRKVTQGVDFVFHLAAAQAPTEVHADALGARHVLHAARAARVRRVIYASSLRVYGPTEGAVCHEDEALPPPQALPPEGAAKGLGERACVDYTREYGLETVRLRYFNVFGPRQPRHSPYARVVSETLEAMLAGRSPVLAGDGRVAQDLVSVGDVVHATLSAVEAPRVAGKAYNIGRGLPTTALDVVAALNSILSTRIKPTFTVARSLNDLDNRADISRAEAELGYCPGEDLERGLRSCVETLAPRTGRPHLGRWSAAAKHDAPNGAC
jgi:UDP-glucose 4-epimerase